MLSAWIHKISGIVLVLGDRSFETVFSSNNPPPPPPPLEKISLKVDVRPLPPGMALEFGLPLVGEGSEPDDSSHW